MDPNRLNSEARLNGAAEFIGVAKLPRWGIRFDLYSINEGCGVTDIVPSKRETVQGVLYRVPYQTVVAPRGERSAMDKIEGAGLGKRSNYKRLRVFVSRNGKKIEARTYVGTVSGRKRFLKKSDDEHRASNRYFGYVLTGARRYKLPANYVAYLRRQAGHIR